MNTNIKQAFIFLAGVFVGGAAAYKLTKIKCEKNNEKMLELIDEEEKVLKNRIDELETELINNAENNIYMPVEEGVEINPSDENPREEAIKKHSKMSSNVYENAVRILDENGKTDYTAYSKKVFADEDEDVMAEYEHPEDDKPNSDKPYLISRDEFTNDNQFYAKEDLTYYERDHVLCGQDQEIIDDISGTIGDDALSSFGEIDPDEPDICHVRNDKRAIDYEIMKVEDSYHEDILGIYDEEGS